jgi:D-methionine transport system substrate-binding protein
MFKTTRRLTLTAAAALALWGAAGMAQAQDVLKVGATAVPHAELLAHVKPALKSQGVDLQIVEFSDYVQPNLAVSDKQLDANFFQHKPYLDSFNKDRKTSLTVVPNGGVHIEPFGAYSTKIKSLKDLKNGARAGQAHGCAALGRHQEVHPRQVQGRRRACVLIAAWGPVRGRRSP